MANETPNNPSQPIIDAHNERTRILGELNNPAITNEKRDELHGQLYAAEAAYQTAVDKFKPKAKL